MNPKHTLKEYADALTRAALLTATTLTTAAENAVIDCLSYDTRSLHGGAPVQAGEKWVATKWLREREFV